MTTVERWYQTQIESGHLVMICWINRRLQPKQIVKLASDRRHWIVVEQHRESGEPGRRRFEVESIISSEGTN